MGGKKRKKNQGITLAQQQLHISFYQQTTKNLIFKYNKWGLWKWSHKEIENKKTIIE